jgi:hypothetical protein
MNRKKRGGDLPYYLNELAKQLEQVRRRRKGKQDNNFLLGALRSGSPPAYVSLSSPKVPLLLLPTAFWHTVERKRFALILRQRDHIRFYEIWTFYAAALQSILQREQPAELASIWEAELKAVLSSNQILDPFVTVKDWEAFLEANGLPIPAGPSKGGRYADEGWKEVAQVMGAVLLRAGREGVTVMPAKMAEEILAEIEEQFPNARLKLPGAKSIQNALSEVKKIAEEVAPNDTR